MSTGSAASESVRGRGRGGGGTRWGRGAGTILLVFVGGDLPPPVSLERFNRVRTGALRASASPQPGGRRRHASGQSRRVRKILHEPGCEAGDAEGKPSSHRLSGVRRLPAFRPSVYLPETCPCFSLVSKWPWPLNGCDTVAPSFLGLSSALYFS